MGCFPPVRTGSRQAHSQRLIDQHTGSLSGMRATAQFISRKAVCPRASRLSTATIKEAHVNWTVLGPAPPELFELSHPYHGTDACQLLNRSAHPQR